MIKIGICDDEPIVCEILKKKVSICLAETKTEAEIECFYSGKELLDNSKKPDILFLDIKFVKMEKTVKLLLQQAEWTGLRKPFI